MDKECNFFLSLHQYVIRTLYFPEFCEKYSTSTCKSFWWDANPWPYFIFVFFFLLFPQFALDYISGASGGDASYEMKDLCNHDKGADTDQLHVEMN